MSVQRLHTETRYSEIVIHNGTVYLAGQLADDIDADIASQTAQTLASIDRLLAEAGSDKSRLLSVQIFLADIGDIAAMNEVWDAWVAPGHTPPRATVQAALADPRWRLEIVVVAAQRSAG